MHSKQHVSHACILVPWRLTASVLQYYSTVKTECKILRLRQDIGQFNVKLQYWYSVLSGLYTDSIVDYTGSSIQIPSCLAWIVRLCFCTDILCWVSLYYKLKWILILLLSSFLLSWEKRYKIFCFQLLILYISLLIGYCFSP